MTLAGSAARNPAYELWGDVCGQTDGSRQFVDAGRGPLYRRIHIPWFLFVM